MIKKVALLLSAAAIVNFSTEPIKALASEVSKTDLSLVALQSDLIGDKAKVNIFNLYGKSELDEYNKAFKMDPSNIEQITNNGGTYGSSTINKAIDGNISTHWETGKPNSDVFTNEVNVKLKESTTLNRIVYATRQDGAKGKGFPEEFEIYTSKTDSGNDFSLVTKGSYTTTGNLVEIGFKPTEFKRIKFVFKKANQNWASASELWFYKEDKLSIAMENLFADQLKTKLSNEYNSKEKIEELKGLLENHPLKSQYNSSIELANELITDPSLSEKYEKNIITLEQLGNPNVDAWTNKGQCYQLSNLLPSGLYFTPGETFVIDVEATNEKLPSIVFDQNYDVKSSSEKNNFELKPGRNVITAPKETNGGGVFFINNYLPSEQETAPKISIKSGGNPYPIFYDGVTDVNKFKEDLKAYNQKRIQTNKDGNIIVPNLVTIVTDHAMVFSLASEAQKIYIENGKSPQDTANTWESLLLDDYEMLGYTKDAANIKHRTPTNRLLARAVKSGLFAGGGLIGIEYPGALLSTSPSGFGWGIFHEVGHVVEMGKLRYLEMTNNLFSLSNQEKAGQSIRIETDAIYNGLWSAYTSGKTMGFGYQSRPDAEVTVGGWSAHLVLWQLRIAYGYDVYTDIFTKSREVNVKGANTSDYWARLASESTGYDLGKYLHRMGMNVQNETLEYTSKFKEVDIAIQYADKNARVYKGNGFEEGYVSKIESINKTKNGVVITVDSKGIEDDLMGFEVYRNDELIGYTNKSSFTDNVGGENEYKIIAFDRKLKPAKISEARNFDTSLPSIQINGDISIAVGDEFNPLEGITAEDGSGNDITSNVTVVENNVDKSAKGEYTIKYKVEDASGNSIEKTRTVNVYGNIDILSSLDWRSATIGWGSVNKNKSVENKPIRLLGSDNKPVQYENGIGTHANSTIIYDIKDKGYEAFTSYIGVDQEMAHSTAASITFEIYVDGKKVYDSGVMKSNTPQKYVSVPLKGSSELKLVVTDAKNGIGSDHGDFANARLLYSDSIVQEKEKLEEKAEDSLVDQEVTEEATKEDTVEPATEL